MNVGARPGVVQIHTRRSDEHYLLNIPPQAALRVCRALVAATLDKNPAVMLETASDQVILTQDETMALVRALKLEALNAGYQA